MASAASQQQVLSIHDDVIKIYFHKKQRFFQKICIAAVVINTCAIYISYYEVIIIYLQVSRYYSVNLFYSVIF